MIAKVHHWLAGLMILCLASTTAHAEEMSIPDPAQPTSATLSEPITHQVELRVVITPPAGTRQLKVWLPLPPSDETQTIERRQLETFPQVVEPTLHTEAVYGNRFAHFVFDQPAGAQIVTHRFEATLHNLHWNLRTDEVTSVDLWPETFAAYLRPQAVVDEQKLQAALAGALPQAQDPTAGLLTAMRWIDQNVTYDHARASLAADANHALTGGVGHCSDYHGLCATMGRKLGYPTRVTYGLHLFAKASPSHCKLEAFLPPYGWISFDLSETQKLVAKISADQTLTPKQKKELTAAARARLESGFRENSWLLVTKGTNYDLAPPAASGPVPVIRTIYAEADGQPLPEPDPANPHVHKFAWMTAHKFEANEPFVKPFEEIRTLTQDGTVDE
ncbi:MAG: transglutaminase domain-containing protein [Pirellulaceae bacterium]